MVNVFSVTAFFIVFREVVEAALIVGICLAYLNKVGQQHMKKWVWWGTGIGVGIALAIGIALTVVYWVEGQEKLGEQAQAIFEGFIYLTASLLITWMIIWMFMVGRSLRTGIESSIDRALQKENAKWYIFFMVFMNVFREAIEVVIFLFGIGSEGDEWKAIPLAGVTGIIVGVAVSILMFKGLLKLDMQVFFMATSMLLVAFAAGLFSRAWHEFQEADWLGNYEEGLKPWWNLTMWNTSECCNDKNNQFFAMLRVLFGYQDKPTYIEFITYFGYWFLMSLAILYIFREEVGAAKNRTAMFVACSSWVMWFCYLIGFIYAVSNVTWIGVMVTTMSWVLSTFAVIYSTEFIAKSIPFVARTRVLGNKLVAVSFIIMVLLVFGITTAQMICQPTTEGTTPQCNLPYFYYWLLVFGEDWSSPVTNPAVYNDYFVSLALLAISLVMTMFYCTFQAYWTWRFTEHINEDGLYDWAPVQPRGYDKYGKHESYGDLEAGIRNEGNDAAAEKERLINEDAADTMASDRSPSDTNENANPVDEVQVAAA
mmetsp:Transcript_8086/g.14382  ORF Transcript_8086/g.14382 Transcript_8086/m.14382 type:complete len:539 (+) Transcript_8086:436-2052(+)